MGLDIGFNIYKKDVFDKEGKLEQVPFPDSSDNWVCGRCNVCNSWGTYFKENVHTSRIPVFQKELDGKKEQHDNYIVEYVYMDFMQFANTVKDAVTDAMNSAIDGEKRLAKRIENNEARIKELRELQKSCTAEQSYAFDRWDKEISTLQDDNVSLKEFLSTYLEDDYDYNHAQAVMELLNSMTGYLSKNEYYVIPYFSY